MHITFYIRILFIILNVKYLRVNLCGHQYIHVKCKNIFTKMLKDVGMEVPKSIETRSKFSMHADKGRG